MLIMSNLYKSAGNLLSSEKESFQISSTTFINKNYELLKQLIGQSDQKIEELYRAGKEIETNGSSLSAEDRRKLNYMLNQLAFEIERRNNEFDSRHEGIKLNYQMNYFLDLLVDKISNESFKKDYFCAIRPPNCEQVILLKNKKELDELVQKMIKKTNDNVSAFHAFCLHRFICNT